MSTATEISEPVEQIGNGLRALLAGVGMSVIIGAIFWCGATYNRVQGIETRLTNIEGLMSKFSDLSSLDVRIQEHQRRLDSLENTVRQLR